MFASFSIGRFYCCYCLWQDFVWITNIHNLLVLCIFICAHCLFFVSHTVPFFGKFLFALEFLKPIGSDPRQQQNTLSTSKRITCCINAIFHHLDDCLSLHRLQKKGKQSKLHHVGSIGKYCQNMRLRLMWFKELKNKNHHRFTDKILLEFSITLFLQSIRWSNPYLYCYLATHFASFVHYTNIRIKMNATIKDLLPDTIKRVRTIDFC